MLYGFYLIFILCHSVWPVMYLMQTVGATLCVHHFVVINIDFGPLQLLLEQLAKNIFNVLDLDGATVQRLLECVTARDLPRLTCWRKPMRLRFQKQSGGQAGSSINA